MKQANQRGIVHILLLFTLVLMALSILARCDIDRVQSEGLKPDWEQADALEPNFRRGDMRLARPFAVR